MNKRARQKIGDYYLLSFFNSLCVKKSETRRRAKYKHAGGTGADKKDRALVNHTETPSGKVYPIFKTSML